MGFDNTLFPTNISFGSAAGPGFSTKPIELAGGGFERISQWETARHKYTVDFSNRSFDDLMVVKSFFLARKGGKQTFLFKDWQDYATNPTHVLYRPTDLPVTSIDQPLQDANGTTNQGVGDGVQTAFQLVKVYSDSIQNYSRNITKPVQGTVLVSIDSVTKTEGTDYTINYQTGAVVFTVAPANGSSVKWGGEFNVTVFFDPAVDEWLGTTLDDFSNGTAPSIGLIEDRDGLTVVDRAFNGGSINHGQQTGTTVQMTLPDGRLHAVTPLDANVTMELPSTVNIAPGGPVFFVHNQGAFNVSLKTSGGTDVIPGGIPASFIASVFIGIDLTGAKVYVATAS